MSSEARSQLTLTERQRFLLEALPRKPVDLAIRYQGAIIVFADTGNPDRLALAAHSIRELCVGLTKSMNVPVLKKGPGLTEEVRKLLLSWGKVRDEAAAYEGQCAKCSDGVFGKFLRDLADFFNRFTGSYPGMKERASKFLTKADVNKPLLPKDREDQLAKQWIELDDFFVKRAHHKPTTEAEVGQKLQVLEDFLLDRLYERPSEDLSVIDEILGEENAN